MAHCLADTAATGRTLRRTAAEYVFFTVAMSLCIAAAAATVIWRRAMPEVCGMTMPGGWTMSMTWMRMPGQTWFAATASFLGMWTVMMVAMMMPSLMPMLQRYRRMAAGTDEARLGRLTVMVGAGYFLVWSAVGIAVFPAGVALAAMARQMPALARAVPLAGGVVVLIAGLLQFTAWKAHRLACCRAACARNAWRHGLDLGLHCLGCCAGPTATLLVAGVMDLRVMLIATAAVTAERLAPEGKFAARIMHMTGVIALGAGLFLIGRAVAF